MLNWRGILISLSKLFILQTRLRAINCVNINSRRCSGCLNIATRNHNHQSFFAKFTLLKIVRRFSIWLVLARLAAVYTVKTVEDSEFDEAIKMPKRLRRFRKFASVEFGGEIYMTPQDFLDSLTLDEPRERVFRTVVSLDQLNKWLRLTPPLRRGSHKMFREIGDNGIISYAEYLFLTTLLTKSHYSFNIAFLMFDEDDNLQIDKEEFFKIQVLIIAGTRQPSVRDKEEGKAFDQANDNCYIVSDFGLLFYGDVSRPIPRTYLSDSQEFEHLISSNVYLQTKNKGKRNLAGSGNYTSFMEKATEEMNKRDTTLTVHLFGKSGRNSLSLDEFQTFYQRIQREIIEIEFNEFSRGKDRISAVDFARLVLRYSILEKEEQSPYIRRVYERSEYDEQGISLQQFEQFSMFLNNLEDFSKAVRLYSLADIPVSQSEFIRAVKCSTGFRLDPGLVNVLYKIFDANADDKLSYREFIAVMNDRLNRGFKSRQPVDALGWKSFKDCVRTEFSGISSG